MKKISLKTLDNLGIERMSREDLKMVQGGNTCGPGEFQCGNGMCIDASMQMDGIEDCPDGSDEGGTPSNGGGGGSCGYILIGNNYSYHECGVSRDRAKSYAEAHIGYTHGYWCCESCSTTSYCGG